jgi:hypothetical protein
MQVMLRLLVLRVVASVRGLFQRAVASALGLFRRVGAAFSVFMAVVLGAYAGAASAVSPFDPLTTAVSFTDVVTALFAVAATIVAVLVTIRGIRWIYTMVKH